MKYILLCGGTGTRFNNYSLPKPLNYIKGKQLIEFIIENIPSDEIYIIYNSELDNYNFREIIINKFKTKKIYFSVIDYLTRGPVETAYVGINEMHIDNNENILFIDNDNIHTFPEFSDNFTNNFLGYSVDYIHENYSFITIDNNNITNIEEKNKISNFYCCGLYGFVSKEIFINLAKEIIDSNFKIKNEFYFSQIYKILCNRKETINPILINSTMHLGTYNEIIEHKNNKLFTKNKLRICFDLDNTLVTYPTTPGDYSTVLPIKKNIKMLNSFREHGHIIIIYTARRMQTHNSNIGKVIKDIALVTLETLNKFNIIYDEIIFGKPIADIYIDDRALNPYLNDISVFGFFENCKEKIINKVKNNKYNKIQKTNEIIQKNGPTQFMRGELFFYQNIPAIFINYFPKLINYKINNNDTEINIEYIRGIPLYFLYKYRTLTYNNVEKLFNILNLFHSCNTDNTDFKNYEVLVKKNYFDKLKDRFNKQDYNFSDAEEIYATILKQLEINYKPSIVSFVHGDFWFSNIILTYNDEFKFIDMKGQLYNELSLAGDKYYDYGKLYQSILGFDLVLNNDIIDQEYINKMNNFFIKKCIENNLDVQYLKAVTKSLIFGTMHSIKDEESKLKIWNFLKNI